MHVFLFGFRVLKSSSRQSCPYSITPCKLKLCTYSLSTFSHNNDYAYFLTSLRPFNPPDCLHWSHKNTLKYSMSLRIRLHCALIYFVRSVVVTFQCRQMATKTLLYLICAALSAHISGTLGICFSWSKL